MDKEYFDPKEDDESWEDCDTYWLSKEPQRSKKWFEQRAFRVTASNFAIASGLSSHETPDEFLDHMTGKKEKILTDKQRLAITHGVEKEASARDWYEKKKGVKVLEVGLAVPKWDPRIGGSVDGVVEGEDGIIEIKCPQRMYYPILNFIQSKKKGWKPHDIYYHSHIWESHYAQMQGGMVIMGKKWCDYIVYCENENHAITNRVYFNQDYWKNVLYPKLCSFLDRLMIELVNNKEKNDKDGKLKIES